MGKTFYLSVLLLVFTGCATTPDGIPSLDGTTWTMVRYVDSSDQQVAVTYPHGKKGNGYWIAFSKDTIYGSDNCNHFSGTVSMRDSLLTTSNIVSTLIGCPDNLNMIVALYKATKFSIADSVLHIYSEEATMPELVFMKVP